MTIQHEAVVFNDILTIEKGDIKDEKGNVFPRIRVNRQDAACILVYNTDSKKIILTRQFRYGAAAKTDEHIMEVVAGKVDAGEDPLQTAIRETAEEIGYTVQQYNMKYLCTSFSTPAYSSERYFSYFAVVVNADKTGKGGGLENENEYIETIEMEVELFKDHLRSGKFLDAKTYITGLQAMANNFF